MSTCTDNRCKAQHDAARLRMSISLHRGLKGVEGGDDHDYWLWAAALTQGESDMVRDMRLDVGVEGMPLIRDKRTRDGEWARIVSLIVFRDGPYYVVEFIDGVKEQWAVYAEGAVYGFKQGQDVDIVRPAFGATETKSP